MKGRERLLHALHRLPVDRVPVAPFIHVNYVKEFFSDHNTDIVEGTIEVYRHFGFDLMHRNCSAAYDHFTAVETPEWRVEQTTERSGRDETVHTVVRTPGGELRRISAVRWTCEYDCEASVVEFPVRTESDLDLCRRYMPPVGAVDVSAIRKTKRAVGGDGILAPWMQGAFNEAAIHYRRVDDLLMDALEQPVFYTALMQFALDRLKAFASQCVAAGADVLSAGGNVANGKLVGPAFFREHIAPYERRLVDFVEASGATLLYHNCGYASRLMDIYPSLGLRAYESLTPPPHGDTALGKAFEVFDPRRTALLGNIDQIDLMRRGSPEEIRACVARTLGEARHWGGAFILGTTDYFNENTPCENIHALAEAGLEFGRPRRAGPD